MRARVTRIGATLTCWLSQHWPWLRWLLLALALAVTVLWPLPALLTRQPSQGLSPAERLKATNDVRGTLVQALAGLALLGGLFFTARTFRLGVKNSDLALQEQLTDRYTKAVEQLGSEKLDVRLGGIYALERLMVDSDRDHPTIVEVLAAFLREHAVLPASASTLAWPLPVGAAAKAEKVALAPMPADIAAAARVIARRPSGRKERGPLDLHGSYLSGADLSGADLSAADLSAADLSGADLSAADLSGARLSGVSLSRARFSGADLSAADLSGARLSGVSLSGADLSGVILLGADLSRADLSDANLSGAVPSGANLSGANLSRANLFGVSLARANLSGVSASHANLSVADLSGANLSEAKLFGAFLLDANLSGANLSGAFLFGAKLSHAVFSNAEVSGADLSDADVSEADLSRLKGLTSEQLAGVRTYEGAILPDYLAEDRR